MHLELTNNVMITVYLQANTETRVDNDWYEVPVRLHEREIREFKRRRNLSISDVSVWRHVSVLSHVIIISK